jgi:hypothetical protein
MQAPPIQAKVIPIVLEGKDMMGARLKRKLATPPFLGAVRVFRVKSADDAHITLRGVIFDFSALIDKKVATLLKFTIK